MFVNRIPLAKLQVFLYILNSIGSLRNVLQKEPTLDKETLVRVSLVHVTNVFVIRDFISSIFYQPFDGINFRTPSHERVSFNS